MALNPAYWGPIFWEVMYLSSAGYSIKPTINEKIGFKMFYDSLRYVLPCVKCRVEYDNYLKKNPLNENDMSTRDNLFKWVYNVHRSVSMRLEKKTIPSLEASKKHFFITSSNAIVLPVRPRPTILAIKRQGISGLPTENLQIVPRNIQQDFAHITSQQKFATNTLLAPNLQQRFVVAQNNTEKHKLLNLLALRVFEKNTQPKVFEKNTQPKVFEKNTQPKVFEKNTQQNSEKNIVVFEKNPQGLFKNTRVFFKNQQQGFIAPKPKFVLGGCGCGGARNN